MCVFKALYNLSSLEKMQMCQIAKELDVTKQIRKYQLLNIIWQTEI